MRSLIAVHFILMCVILTFTFNVYAQDENKKDDPDAPAAWLEIPKGFTAIFNAKNLSGWEGRFDNIVDINKLSKSERTEKQKEANALMEKHWYASEEGTLIFDGRGQGIKTKKSYKDFELLIEWKVKARGSTGIYLRGYPQVQLWDSRIMEMGSGGLFNNKKKGKAPSENADRSVTLWNKTRIKMIGRHVWVWMNDKLVNNGAVLENFWNRNEPIALEGPIELENDDNTLYFRNIFIREIDADEARKELNILKLSNANKPNAEADEKTTVLFDGKTLDHWTYKKDGWFIEDGTMARNKGAGYIWSKQKYENFTLELEYKLSAGCNSGVFFRTDPKNAVQGGFEIQLMDSFGKKTLTKRDGGAFYDAKEPSKNTNKKAGEWNKMKLTCDGPKIMIWQNGEKIIDVNIDDWKTPNMNPDGTKNKFKKALKALPRNNHIGFQDHGHPVWFRNVRITRVE